MNFMTTAELAVHLSVSVRHVERRVAAGMPSISVGSRAKRYDPTACIAWLAEHARELSPCQSNARPKGATKSASRFAVAAFTAECRQAQVRVLPGGSKPN